MANYDLAVPGAAIDAILTTAYDLQNAGYIFKGSATNWSGTPTQRTWLLAPAGFSGYGFSSAIPKGSIGICKYNGSAWSGDVINVVTIDSTVTNGSTNAVSSDAVWDALDELATGIRDTLLSFTITDGTASADQTSKLTYDVKMTDGQGGQHLIGSFNILAATAYKAGLMSAADKAKVDSFLTILRSMTFADTTPGADVGTKIVETLKMTVDGVQEAVTALTILAATTSKAGLMSATDKAYIDGLPSEFSSISGSFTSINAAINKLLAMLGYYECSTAAGTAAKTVSASGYVLTTGGCIRIKMANANTADNVTLNINSTGAKALYYDGAQASSSNTWEAGEVLEVYYDGTQYQCASSCGGGKFATGQKVKEVGITDELDNSHNLIESAAINAVLNESINFSEWVVGSLNSSHTYLNMTGRIEACAVIDGRALNYTIASGYAMSIHEYSGEFYTIPTIIGNTWIKQSSSWIEGNGVYTPTINTKTIVIILSKTPTSSSLTILPSDASNLTINYQTPFTLDGMREMLAEHDAEISAMDTEIDEIKGELYSEITDAPVWYQGTLVGNVYSASGGVAPQRIICTVPAPSVMDVTVATGYYCSIHEYSDFFQNPTQITSATSWLGNTHGWFDGTLKVTPLAAAKTMVLIMAKGSSKNQNVTPADGSNISVEALISIKGQTEINTENIDIINNTLYGQAGGVVTETVAVEQGGVNADGTLYNSSARIRTAGFLRVSGEFTLNFTNSIWYNVFYYLKDSESTYVKSLNSGSWSTDSSLTDEWDGYIKVGMRNSDNTNLTPTATTVTLTHNTHVAGLEERFDEYSYADSNSYVWGCDMVKRKVKASKIGALKYLQAFCKYDGKYYSTNGNNIAEQDSSFTLLRDVSCNVGHGNSLQLVSNGKAWASGWNDQKMYRVDLATLTVDQTVTLPTTGYTTCVVDEDNGIIYIFQRDTNPNYVGQYTFIVYDYVNQQIISTRKIESFAAMQAVDYYQGKILMLYGLGTTTAPSGMYIYNTVGDVIATFDLDIFRAKEPEGIMFTRDTFELLVSDVNNNLYLVT